MHIPEGYLGPHTYGAAYAVMLPIWALAGRAVRRTLSARRVPLLAIGAAFSFVIMMFNIPIPGAISVVLTVQAFLFGDGGITALAANCFNMAFLMPFASYVVYRVIAYRSATRSVRRLVAAGVAGYVGINVAALSTAVMFGIQPMLASGPDGRPLYCPFGLNVAVPVMAAEHLLLFGVVEGLVTALAVAYLARTEPQLLETRALPRKGGAS